MDSRYHTVAMADARGDAITTLARVMALIDVAEGGVDAALLADDDPWLARAKVALGYAGKDVARAAGMLRGRYERPDGQVSALGFVAPLQNLAESLGVLLADIQPELGPRRRAAGDRVVSARQLLRRAIDTLPPEPTG
jgi:hypothetical protein